MHKQHHHTTKTDAPKNPGVYKTPDASKSKSSETFDRADYIRKLEAQAKEWESELAAWSAKTTGQVESEFHGWQKNINSKLATARKQLDQLRSTKNEAWDSVKDTADKAWSEVKSAFDIGKNKFH